MTPHNEAKLGEIAKNVIMPGDPLRAKYIAEHYLDNYKLVNQIRGMYAYTGTYKGKPVTIMGSGMGMPSMGIYAYELFKFYQVEKIIRLGSAGAYTENLEIFDLVLTDKAYTASTFAQALNGEVCHEIKADISLNEHILNTAQELGYKITLGNTSSSDVFDEYATSPAALKALVPPDAIATEMEAFALLYLANMFGKKAATILTIVDSMYKNHHATAEERQKALNKMIELGLNAII